MIISVLVAGVWLGAALLFAAQLNWLGTAVALVNAPVALAMTIAVRKMKVALAARTYLSDPGALRNGGVVIDTDALPSWPFQSIAASALLGLAALIVAVVRAW